MSFASQRKAIRTLGKFRPAISSFTNPGSSASNSTVLGLRQGGDVPEGDVRAAVDWIETALAGVNAKRLRNVEEDYPHQQRHPRQQRTATWSVIRAQDRECSQSGTLHRSNREQTRRPHPDAVPTPWRLPVGANPEMQARVDSRPSDCPHTLAVLMQ